MASGMKWISSKIVFLFCLVIILGISKESKAQDIHFSQYFFSPLSVNPAQTGFFNGTYRIAGNHRRQWAFHAPIAFTTFSTSVDFHLLDGATGRGDFFGIGVFAVTDEAGSGGFKTTGVKGSISYYKQMDEFNGFSVGIQGGMIQMGFVKSTLRFGDEILLGVVGSQNLANINMTSVSYVDFSAGALWSFSPNEDATIFTGIAMDHLTKPNISFMGSNNTLSSRVLLHSGANIHLNDEWDLLPNILYMHQLANNELLFGSSVRYKVDKEIGTRVGVFYRYWNNSDAATIVASLEYSTLLVSFSYDVNVSLLSSASKGAGGYEIALIYLGTVKGSGGPAKMKCPKF